MYIGSRLNESLMIVISLPIDVVLPVGARYRKFKLRRGWYDFVENARNSLSSAKKDSDGNCPAPLSASYLPGLIAGNDCIEMKIEDGGPNDVDNHANGTIEDPGGFTVAQATRAGIKPTDRVLWIVLIVLVMVLLQLKVLSYYYLTTK